jgi:hypothetical protein
MAAPLVNYPSSSARMSAAAARTLSSALQRAPRHSVLELEKK